MNILITGGAGFIGYHLAKSLSNKNNIIYICDNLNNYYDRNLKLDRINNLLKNKNIIFNKLDINHMTNLKKLFDKSNFDIVIHLAAQAGVRYSLSNPKKYINTNIIGSYNIFENCKNYQIKNLYYASSSSVYGNNLKQNFSETDNTDFPTSLYAATKKTNEILAHSYSYLYNIPTTALRFFTVYGPWGRPDMAYFNFMNKIIGNEHINVYGNGLLKRSFTYIDDIIFTINKLLELDLNLLNKNNKLEKFRILNIGFNNSVSVNELIYIIEKILGKKALVNYINTPKTEVIKTCPDSKKLISMINYSPSTDIETGMNKFINWYLNYYNKK